MKVKDLISELSKLDPEQDILFAKSNWASDISVDAELINGYSLSHSKKDIPFGIRSPSFIDHKRAHRICEDGKTFLSFKSRHVKPAIYLRSKEPDFQSAYNKYLHKQTENEGVEQAPLFGA